MITVSVGSFPSVHQMKESVISQLTRVVIYLGPCSGAERRVPGWLTGGQVGQDTVKAGVHLGVGRVGGRVISCAFQGGYGIQHRMLCRPAIQMTEKYRTIAYQVFHHCILSVSPLHIKCFTIVY